MTRCDVLVVGAGPAGSVAAAVLARAGRARASRRSRDVSARQAVRRHGQSGRARDPARSAWRGRSRRAACAIDGMRVTGGRGVAIEGRYPGGLSGRRDRARDLDLALLEAAMAAGARFEPARARAIAASSSAARVVGVTAGERGARELRARGDVIAADGRRSTLAFGLGLARHPGRPRRWAIGAYFEGVGGLTVARRDARPARALHRRRAAARRRGERLRGDCLGGRAIRGSPIRPRSSPARSRATGCSRDRFAGARAASARPWCSARSPSTPRRRAIDGLLRRRRRRRLHRSDDRRRPPLRAARRASWPPTPRSPRSITAGAACTRRSPSGGAASSRRSGASTACCARWSPRRARSTRRRSAPASRRRSSPRSSRGPATARSRDHDDPRRRRRLRLSHRRGAARGGAGARAARARRRRAGGRRLSRHARGVSGRVRRDDRRGRAARRAAVAVGGGRRRALRRGEGAQVVGDRDARAALDVSRDRRAERRARRAQDRTGGCATPTTSPSSANSCRSRWRRARSSPDRSRRWVFALLIRRRIATEERALDAILGRQ